MTEPALPWVSDDPALLQAIKIAEDGAKRLSEHKRKREVSPSSDSSSSTSSDEDDYPCQMPPDSPPRKQRTRKVAPKPVADQTPESTLLRPPSPAEDKPLVAKPVPPAKKRGGRPRRTPDPTAATAVTTQSAAAESAAAAAAAMEAQQEYNTWTTLVTPEAERVLSKDYGSAALFIVRAMANKSPGSLVDCLVAVAIGTLSPPGMSPPEQIRAVAPDVVPRASDIRRSIGPRVMAAFIPPLIGDRLVSVVTAAVRHTCLGCNEALPEDPADPRYLFLCDECIPVFLVASDDVDEWNRQYIPSINVPPPVRGAPPRVMHLRRHVEDFDNEIKKYGDLGACIRAFAESQGGKGIQTGAALVAAAEGRKRKRGDDEESIGELLGPLADRIGDLTIASLESMCRILGDKYHAAVAGLAGRHKAAIAAAEAAVCARACSQKKQRKRPPSVARPPVSSPAAELCAARLVSMARRWQLVEREYATRGPTVAGFLGARVWQFPTKPIAKARSRVFKNWLMAEDRPGGEDDTRIPLELDEALTRFASMSGQTFLLDASSTVQMATILTPLFDETLSLRMTNLPEPPTVGDLLAATGVEKSR